MANIRAHGPLLLGCLAIAISGCTPTDWNQEQIVIAKDRGATVIAALDIYRNNHGRFPKKLADLVPDNLNELPATGIGTGQWDYIPYPDGSKYTLMAHSQRRVHYMVFHSWARHEGWWIVED